MNIDRMEQFISGVSPVGDAVEIPPEMFAPLVAEFSSVRGGEDDLTPANVVQLVALSTFQDQWGMVHDMAGGMIQARTMAPCDLGTMARNEGGRVACEAAYNLIASVPALARMILSPESTYMGQIAAIAMHGFACVQMVKASAIGATLTEENSVHG